MMHRTWVLAVVGASLLGVGGCGGPGGEGRLPWSSIWRTPSPTATTIYDDPPVRSNQPRNGTNHLNAPVVATGESSWANVSGRRAWRYIVIHHSASERGNAAVFNAEHKSRGWDGLGYHFVIDNGHGGPDGAVEVGYRWRGQRTGAHTGKTPGNAYNEQGIGICMVGDFTGRMPSRAQLASLDRLVRYLCATYSIPASRVIGHRDAPNTATQCPGNTFHRYLHSTYRPHLARGR